MKVSMATAFPLDSVVIRVSLVQNLFISTMTTEEEGFFLQVRFAPVRQKPQLGTPNESHFCYQQSCACQGGKLGRFRRHSSSVVLGQCCVSRLPWQHLHSRIHCVSLGLGHNDATPSWPHLCLPARVCRRSFSAAQPLPPMILFRSSVGRRSAPRPGLPLSPRPSPCCVTRRRGCSLSCRYIRDYPRVIPAASS